MEPADARRWAALFADLDAQYDGVAAAELGGEVRDRARGESARLALVDRLRAAEGAALTVEVRGVAAALRGTVQDVGPDWLLLDDGRDVLIPLDAVLSVSGLGPWAVDGTTVGAVASRLGLRHALRELSRRRVAVTLTLVDGRTAHGTLDRVGADFVELAEHPAGEPRRARAVRAVRAVPFGALGYVRSA